MIRTTLAIVLAFAFAANAETPDEQRYREAVERLNAKAATQPGELERLRKENSELRAKVAVLEKRLKELEAKAKPLPHRPGKPNGAEQVKIGMTLEEVQKIMRTDGKPIRITAEGETRTFHERWENHSVRDTTINFVNGKVVEIWPGDWERSPFAPKGS